MEKFDLKLIRVLLLPCSFGLILYYFFPALLFVPFMVMLGVLMKRSASPSDEVLIGSTE
ncbi:MAG: hypothetical protein AAFY71_12585 [Bacteroidota bacterium]